jgi:hypothetical protein
MVYYKATRPDGMDFATGTVDYAEALETGEVLEHDEKMVRDKAATYFSVSVEPADCTGVRWPCRLFRVEPVGRVLKSDGLPNKRCCSRLRVVEELPAHLALGPNGEAVAALIERAGRLTWDEVERLVAAGVAARGAAGVAVWGAAWGAARDAARGAAWAAARDAARGAAGDAAGAARDGARGAAWDAARDAAWDAARGAAGDAAGAAWDGARGAAWDAARALVVRDLISKEHFNVLYGPWAEVVGDGFNVLYGPWAEVVGDG